MFSKNLKYYRLKKKLSKKELAEKINITPMAITNYEKGERKPDMDILTKLASALEIKISDFLIVRNNNLVFKHEQFRKNSRLTKEEQEFVRESVEEFINRFMTIVEILGGDVLPLYPKVHSIKLSEDHEENGENLRKHLNLSLEGPIGNLYEILENKGILVYQFDFEANKFSGLNGFVNGRPYVVVNKNMTAERTRSTIAHELAHLMFNWNQNENEEDCANAISGAFLFPKEDALRELGIHRTRFSRDMIYIAAEYGVSTYLLVKRAELLNIISKAVSKDFYINAGQAGWKHNEPSRIPREYPLFFEQLVYRALSENEINFQRASELLMIPYNEVFNKFHFEAM